MAGGEGWKVIGPATGSPPAKPRPRGDPRRTRIIVFAVATVAVLGGAGLLVALSTSTPEEAIALDETAVGVALSGFKGVVRTNTKDMGIQYHFGENKDVPDEPGNDGSPLLGIEVDMPGDTLPVGTAMACAWGEASRLPDGLRQASTLFHLADADDPEAWGSSGAWGNVSTVRLPVADGVDLDDVVALAYDVSTRDWTPASISDASDQKIAVTIGRPTAIVLAAPNEALPTAPPIGITGFQQAADDLAEAVAMASYTAWHATHPEATAPLAMSDDGLGFLVEAQAPLLAAATPERLDAGPAITQRISTLLATGDEPVLLWTGTADQADHVVVAYAATGNGLSVYDPEVPGQGLTIGFDAGGLAGHRGSTHYAIGSFVALGDDALYQDPASAAAPVASRDLHVQLLPDEPAFYDLSLYVVGPDGRVAWKEGADHAGSFETTPTGATFALQAGDAPAGEYGVWVYFEHGPGRDPTGHATVTIQVGDAVPQDHDIEIFPRGGGAHHPDARGTREAPNQGWAFVAAVQL